MVAKELSYSDGGTVFAPLPTSLPFDFRIYESGTPIVHASWLENYSTVDVGMSFFAPPHVIAGATAARSSTTALSVLTVNGSGFHSTPEPWWLGIPSDHYITAIERVVDNLVIAPIHQTRYTVLFTQRIRIWTEPIPEPRTMVLLAIVLSCGCISRRTARVRHRH
jgi:hypothetical protein